MHRRFATVLIHALRFPDRKFAFLGRKLALLGRFMAMHRCFAIVVIRFVTPRIRPVTPHRRIVSGTAGEERFKESAWSRSQRNLVPLLAAKIYRLREKYFAIFSLRGRNHAPKSKYV
jgi:hypothetical protein